MRNFSLKAERAVVDFEVKSTFDDLFDYTAVVRSTNSKVTFISDSPYRMYRNDVERLIRYFEDHVAALLSNDRAESPVFVPQELSFQIRALDGVVESPMDGYFTVCFMLNCGVRGYWGFEGILDLVDLNEFCAKLGNVLPSLSAMENEHEGR